MNQIYGIEYKRINKTMARRLFIKGEDILVVPCNVPPVRGVFSQEWTRSRYQKDGEPFDELFNRLVNAWAYYNACCQLGYYPAFYVRTEVLLK